VFYCKDAFEGLDWVEALTQSGDRDAVIARVQTESAAVA
jgi:hypothetical protein